MAPLASGAEDLAVKKSRNIMVAGEEYVAIVLQVIARDPDGSIRDLRVLRDDESLTLTGDEAFVVVYAHKRAFARTS